MIDNYECEVINHLGDITKLDGAKIPKVDVICGGSPCQDLSVAGKREGLSGERSGLFMEQIRIIKEMRESDRASGRTNVDIRPRYMVWENVPGAFSSNKGEDFRIVLEETAKVVEKDACIPGPPNKGKWTPSGCIMGNGWSLAWRVHDAQFWGVPQRRKRISLVADFGGATAPEILFERKGLSRDTSESGEARKGTAEDAEGCFGKTGAISFQERAGKPGGGKGILIQNERTGALSTLNNQSVCAFEPGVASRVGGHVYEDGVAGTVRANAGDNQQAVVYGISSYDSNAMKSGNPNSGIYEADTSRTLDLNGGSPACNQGGMMVVQAAGVDTYNQSIDEEVAQPLRAADGGDSTPKVVCIEGNGSRPSHRGDGYSESETMHTLNSTEHHAVCKIYSMGHDIRSAKFTDDEITDPLTATDYKDPIKISTYQKVTDTIDTCISKGTSNQLAHNDMFVANSYIVRRLTPLECERLQGFPDNWTNIGEWIDSKGKKHKDADSPRYKALGNSIALPFWQYLADKMCAYLKEPTMGSLFDGIGGFPLVFSRAGATPVWASEIEEFPIAVTKLRFSKETN